MRSVYIGLGPFHGIDESNPESDRAQREPEWAVPEGLNDITFSDYRVCSGRHRALFLSNDRPNSEAAPKPGHFRLAHQSRTIIRCERLKAETRDLKGRVGGMLRRLLILGLLAAMALPSHAAKRLSVAQLEQVLTADASKHKQDIEIAEQLAGMALTERIPESTIERLTAQLAANPRASLVFRVLANEAEFLDLPRAESVAESAPEPIAQKRMLEAARDYVSETLARLPNLLATRTINLYDDTPHAIKQGGWPTRLGLHQVGTSRAEISVLREREDQPPTQGSAVWQSKIGLVSGGEFGTTLGMIFADSAKGDVHWSNWERSSTGLLAVFAYSVPAPVSHFEVITSFQREENVEAFSAPTGERGVSGIATRPNVSSTNVAVVHTRPAYHGAIWLDPATGTIHRITMEADMKKDLPFRRAAILVEYGPIEIAGARFICPVRSLALSESLPNTQSLSDDAATEWLNEILFTDYHRFASSARITEQAAAAPLRKPHRLQRRRRATRPRQPMQPNRQMRHRIRPRQQPRFKPRPQPCRLFPRRKVERL